MHTLLATLHDAGFVGWILLGAAAAGGIASLAGLGALAFRARATLALGVVATALGILCAGLGGAGVVRARLATDAEIEARRCIEERVQRAAVLSSLGAVRADLEAVARSPFAQHDPALAALIAADLEEVQRISRENTARALETSTVVQVETGRIHVAGDVSEAVVARVVRQNLGRFRLCYEHALGNDPTVQGHVDVRFTIGRDGAAAAPVNIGSDLRDAGMAACVVRHFGSLSFPGAQPATVLVDMRFAPPDADPLDRDEPVR